MRLRQTIKTYLLGLASLALLVGVSSCERDQIKLQQVQLVNMQLERFVLFAKEHTALSAIPFSIENASPEGRVVNTQPLPYGVQLDKVQLHVVPTAAAAKVEVAIGEQGEFADWSAEKEYTIGSDVSVLRLRLSLRTEQHGYYEYLYRVQLRRYKFDPETIEWGSVTAAGLPQSGDGYMFAQPRGEDVLILRSSALVNEYYSYKDNAFAAVQLSGLEGGERIVQATSYGHTPYIYTSTGRICRLQGTAWQPIDTGAEVKALLGVLAPREPSREPRLALIIERAGKEVFASYADGQLSTRGLAVPASFPRRAVYAFGENKTYVGAALTLVGEQLEGATPVQSSWYTTGLAEDWIQIGRQERPDRQGARPGTVLLLDGTLYRFETVGGLSLYTSTDQGRSWRKNSDKALPNGASNLADLEILGYPTSDHTIHLLHNVSVSSGAAMELLYGRPKKYDL